METSYLKLMKGSRLTNYMGLEVDPGAGLSLGTNYMYIDIPVRGVSGEDEKLVQEIKRNQHVYIEAAATVDVKGRNMIEVEPNIALAEMGQVQGSYRIHPGSGQKRLGFWFTARRDCDLAELQYAVRIYMPA